MQCAADYHKQCKTFTHNQEDDIICSADHKAFCRYVNKEPNVRQNIGALKSDKANAVINYNCKAQTFEEFFPHVLKKDDGILPEFPVRNIKSLTTVNISTDIVLKCLAKLKKKQSITNSRRGSTLLSKADRIYYFSTFKYDSGKKHFMFYTALTVENRYRHSYFGEASIWFCKKLQSD